MSNSALVRVERDGGTVDDDARNRNEVDVERRNERDVGECD